MNFSPAALVLPRVCADHLGTGDLGSLTKASGGTPGIHLIDEVTDRRV